jgi:hypothetical protein
MYNFSVIMPLKITPLKTFVVETVLNLCKIFFYSAAQLSEPEPDQSGPVSLQFLVQSTWPKYRKRVHEKARLTV